ncbi:endonuclease/exonuclease/phosphatase family protein [Streptomyces sp. ST2-7A]|uniref:endonuclease/exonuclease/phosphatase family protein n=1 Tax=Streptomyces sp. ST2-7A TaxID=2907214 RepID=UPI001F3AA716|nr:endonuclease/exonuclease/phosphatase family protein [Streptomyces sp. ST2-7A]MCE7083301.1 endonuclease/exonuclease/phosphatase family protein [Streptomyces sp. ST2-7A]
MTTDEAPAPGGPDDTADPDDTRIGVRLVTWNVRGLRDDRTALIRVLRALDPDVLCLQEMPRFLGWRRHAARLAGAADLRHVVGGAPTCGTAVMVGHRVRVDGADAVPLPHHPGLHRRIAARARLRVDTAPLTVISCHLGLDGRERRAHFRPLLVAAAPGPVVIAGDLNERPSGPVFRRFAEVFRDAGAESPAGPGPAGGATFPARAPDRRIDAVLCDPTVGIEGCGTPDPTRDGRAPDPEDLRRASDHLPVLALLRVPSSPRGPRRTAAAAPS